MMMWVGGSQRGEEIFPSTALAEASKITEKKLISKQTIDARESERG